MELSYSFHLSNDKNKTARAKEQAKKNNSNYRKELVIILTLF